MSPLPIFLWSSLFGTSFLLSLWKLRGKILFHPHPHFDDIPGCPFHNVNVKIEKHGNIHGWLFLPFSSPLKKIIILSHGNAGNISHRLHFVDFWLDYLQNEGIALFLYDYLGYGKSLFNEHYREPSVDSCKISLQNVIMYFITSKGYQPQDIILYGESIGGAITAAVAADIQETIMVHQIILQSTFTSLKDMAFTVNYSLGLVARLLPEELDVLKFCNILHQKGANILCMHSLTDEIIPFEMFYKISQYASQSLILSGTHNDVVLDDSTAKAILSDGRNERM